MNKYVPILVIVTFFGLVFPVMSKSSEVLIQEDNNQQYLPLLIHQKREGERLSVYESGSQTFPANTPFHVAHGWRHDFPLENVELFDFELEVNGVYQLVDFVESTIDQSSDPHTLTKHSVFNFPEGMTGTHTFNGHWIAPCYAFFDDCDDPFEIWESVTEVLVTFAP
jgi:hypothetical protein